MMRQQELVERVLSYDPDCNEALLNKAYVFAMRAHGNDKRHSGDPYFSHPIEVAGILTELRLDTASITTALLHDTVEDTLATSEQIHELFGEEVGALVDGVTKLSKLELSGEGALQAQNFRKLLIAMSKDIRVLLVKLADRLHNMRTLHFHPKVESRRRIAQETMEIFAPLAGRIGMQEIREELEDLSFANLNPIARDSILKRLEYLQAESGASIARIKEAVEHTLAAKGVIATVQARQKKAYSIWRKMQAKDITFEQLADIHAFRVIVEDEDACYRVLGIVHGAWPVVPGRFKDFISNPKRNGYRSLHTTVIGPERQRAEFQIRSQAMHEVAEKGLAAHWRYKEMAGLFDDEEGGAKPLPESEAQAYRWLRGLVEMVEQGDNADEDLEHTKMELFLDQVFCFTPKGSVIILPKGATAIDFAYAVHTDVGDTCVGCKINGRRLPIRTRVRNGDQVEIIRSRTQKPSPAWEHIAITGKARAAIRRHVRADKRAQHITLGREVLEQAAAAENVQVTDKGLKNIISRYEAEEADDLLAMVGSGDVAAADVVHALYPSLKLKAGALRFIGGVRPKEKADARSKRQAIAVKGLTPGLAVHYAPCCHPLPGDRIVGVMAPGQGVVVHTIDCERLGSDETPQTDWLDLSWQKPGEADENMLAVGRIRVLVANQAGALGELTTLIARSNGNIFNLKITDRAQDFFEMLLDLEVTDAKHLADIMAALRTLPLVSQVERVRG